MQRKGQICKNHLVFDVNKDCNKNWRSVQQSSQEDAVTQMSHLFPPEKIVVEQKDPWFFVGSHGKTKKLTTR